MKMLLATGLIALVLITTSFLDRPLPSLPLTPLANFTTVMSYNIDLEHTDAAVSWRDRRNVVAQVIRTKKPEILGIQESTPSQTSWLSNAIEGYDWYALGNDERTYQQDMCPIFYKRGKFTRLDEGSFWLPASVTDAEKPAKTVNWLALLHKESGKKLFVFNTQFLKGDQECQNNSAHLLKERIDGITDGASFVILGDLNCEPQNEPMLWMTTWVKDSHESCLLHTTSMTKTFFGWKQEAVNAKRLDYVLLSKDIPSNSHEVVDLSNKGNYPSDHLPVYCRLRFQ